MLKFWWRPSITMGTFVITSTCLTLLIAVKVSANAEAALTIQNQSSNSSDSVNSEAEAQAVLNLLGKGEEILNTEYHRDAVLVLGNTGSGKSTFTQFITGNDFNLTSYETEEGSGDFIIRDISGRISNDSAITSWTIFPEALMDGKSKTVFFDCPGFSDTRSVAHDITATYFTKKTLDHIGRVKLVFTVAYSSVRVGQDRQDFTVLAEHAVTMVKNIDKLKDSIALVVTKVENLYSSSGKIVSDEKVIQSVAGFLVKAKSEIQRKIQTMSISAERRQSLSAVMKFIDILLQKSGDSYARIGIFRKPDEVGPLRAVNSLRESKKPLEKMIHQNIQYTAHEMSDFGHTISSSSKNSIHSLVETIKKNIMSDVSRLNREIKEIFLSYEEKSSDVQDLHVIFQRAFDVLSGACENIKIPQDFVKCINSSMKTLNIKLDLKPLSSIEKQISYLEFFSTFGARDITPSEYTQDLPILMKYLSSTENYYKTLVRLSNALSNCDLTIKNNTEEPMSFANIPQDQSEASKKEHKRILAHTFAHISLPQKDQQILDSEYLKIKNIEFNKPKLKWLEMIWMGAVLTKTEVLCQQSERRLTLQSSCLRLGKFAKTLDSLCPTVKLIEIFASEKVIIDSDLDLTGREAQVSIIAPVWEVVGPREIVLSGLEGKTHSPQKAGQIRKQIDQSGFNNVHARIHENYFSNARTAFNEIGENGSNGQNGSSAGSFLGIGGKFVDGRLLQIFAIGGKGGPGQDGGDGAEGSDGTVPEYNIFSNSHSTIAERNCGKSNGFWAGFGAMDYDFVCGVTGFDCIDGGNGGDGGAGGIGGSSGEVLLIGPGQDMIIRNAFKGESGRAGLGGHGGKPGEPGRAKNFRYYKWVLGKHPKIEAREEWSRHECSWGEEGKDGSELNPELTQGLGRENKLLHPGETVERYKNFALHHLNISFNAINLRKFLRENLEGQKAVKALHTSH